MTYDHTIEDCEEATSISRSIGSTILTHSGASEIQRTHAYDLSHLYLARDSRLEFTIELSYEWGTEGVYSMDIEADEAKNAHVDTLFDTVRYRLRSKVDRDTDIDIDKDEYISNCRMTRKPSHGLDATDPDSYTYRIEFNTKIRSEDIVVDDRVMPGVARIDGTRVSTKRIWRAIESGQSIEDVQERYPFLSEKEITAAKEYQENLTES